MSARDALEAYVVHESDKDQAEYARRLNAYRDEVLAEADLLPKADVVAWLTKKARENTPVWQLASKVDRGAVRPNNLRMLPPDFFEPDHTYTASRHADIAFDCLAVSVDPGTGERVAVGWRYGPPRDGVREVYLKALDAAAFACCDWAEGHITDGGDV